MRPKRRSGVLRNSDRILPQAIEAHTAGRIEEARQAYDAVLRIQPNQPDANHNLGLICASENNHASATKLFQNAVTENPRNQQFWLSYINNLIHVQKFEKAAKALRKAKRHGLSNALERKIKQSARAARLATSNHKHPDENEINNLVFQHQNSDSDSSKHHAMAFTKKFPQNTVGWKILAAAFYGCEQFEDALRAIKQAAELNPLDAETINSVGAVLKRLGRYQEAVRHYEESISLAPELWEAHINLANAHKDRGDLRQAEASYLNALALRSDSGEALYQLGSISQERGLLAQAETLYKRALLALPDKAEVLIHLGSTLHQLGKFDEAIAILERATSSLPEDGRAMANLGMAKYALGDRAEAIRCFHRACEVSPDESQFRALYAILSKDDYSTTSGNLKRHCSEAVEPKEPHYAIRPVENDLCSTIYQLPFRELENTPDSRFGAGRCSKDYKFFEERHPLIRSVQKDLTWIMKNAVGGDVLVVDSFFNIYSANCGIQPHTHLNRIDSMRGINLGSQKFSLVYYVDTGDQDCDVPGVLQFHEPDEEVLPQKGMAVVFPASRLHSASYGGAKDRIMIGANFYRI